MQHIVRNGALALLVALATGCAGVSGPRVDTGADRPVSDTPAANPAQARAKISAELGMAYFEIGRFDVALDEAKVALAHDSGYAPAYHLLGLVYMFLEDNGVARENFNRALALAPRDPEINNSFGWFQCVNGQEQEGLQRLLAAARNPYYRHPSRAHTNAGLCLVRMGDDTGAAEQFRRALAFDAGNSQARFLLAQVEYRQGDYLGARQQLVELHQRREPTAETAWLGLRTERRLGNRDSEASYAAQLSGRFGTSPEYKVMMQGLFE